LDRSTCSITFKRFQSTLTFTVKLDGLLPFASSPNRDFYQRMLINSGMISISHLGATGSAISYNGFLLDADGRLITRDKTQVLMQGPYGMVFARSTYYYGKQYNHQPTDFYADLYFSRGSHEPSQQAEEISNFGELSAVSVVRVFKAAPQFLVICATYDASGRLAVLSVNGSKNGDWVHSSEIQALYPDLDVATIYVDTPKTRKYFGLPQTFPIAEYLKSPRDEAQNVELSLYSDTVNLHYHRNRFVRQDDFGADGSHTTRFLKYAITPEDLQLEPVDDLIGFGHNARAPES
jgi:hypothetical protein